MTYSFWALRSGAPYRKLRIPADRTPSITWTADAQIKRTCKLQCLADDAVDWLTDMLAVWREDASQRVWLGVFFVTTCPTVTDEDGRQLYDITGYDLAYALTKLSILEQTQTIVSGTNYDTAIREQLIAAGIDQLRITPSAQKIPVDHAYPAGTPRYKIVSDLLGEINYRTIWFDGSGSAVCEPWAAATIDARTHIYEDGSDCLMQTAMQREDDLFDAANVFVCVVSSADFTKELRAESVNDRMDSPLSVQRRGRRIVQVETLDSIAGQDALQVRANNRKIASMMGTALYTLTTRGDEESAHGLNDSLLVQREEVGLLQEQDWSLACVPGGAMTHTGKRVYYVD